MNPKNRKIKKKTTEKQCLWNIYVTKSMNSSMEEFEEHEEQQEELKEYEEELEEYEEELEEYEEELEEYEEELEEYEEDRFLPSLIF
jgi:chromosome segregation ATPase